MCKALSSAILVYSTVIHIKFLLSDYWSRWILPFVLQYHVDNWNDGLHSMTWCEDDGVWYNLVAKNESIGCQT